MHEVLTALFAHAALHPDAPAVVTSNGPGQRIVSWQNLARRVAGTAAVLDDMPPTVGLLLPRGLRAIAADLALALLGRTVVPLPDFFSDAQLAHVIADAGVGAIVTSAAYSPRAEALGRPWVVPEPAADGPCRPIGTDHLHLGHHRPPERGDADGAPGERQCCGSGRGVGGGTGGRAPVGSAAVPAA